MQHGNGLLELCNALESEPENRYHFRCICGHRGSGKSAEVLGLAQRARANGYLPVRIVATEYFGSSTPKSTDSFCLMAIAAEQAADEVKYPLPPDAIASVVKWSAEVLNEDSSEIKSEIGIEATAQIGSNSFSLIQLIAKLSATIKAGSAWPRSGGTNRPATYHAGRTVACASHGKRRRCSRRRDTPPA